MSDNPIVGHATFRNPDGTHCHEPIRKDEADALSAAAKDHEAVRAVLMPDVQSAIKHMFDGYLRLKELGWNDAIYCPKDGSIFEVIEPGSTGIHRCHYEGKWPTGSWWVHDDDGDMGPSRPVLFRLIAQSDGGNR